MQPMTPEQIRDDFYFRLNELEGKPRTRTINGVEMQYRGDGTLERTERAIAGIQEIRQFDELGELEHVMRTPLGLLKCSTW
jgi:hypothetical protein